MLKKILYLIDALLRLIVVVASGLGFFMIISTVVQEVWGQEWLRVPALLVFLLSGFFISMGFLKLLDFVQREILHIQGKEIEEEMMMDDETRALIEHLREYLLSEAGVSRITVNAAPYGVAFYHKLGFQDLRPEEEKDGIRYTPMEFIL